MDFEFEITRTGLLNDFVAAGAKLLGYQPLVSTAVAMIPGASPQKYAIAGTLPGILQMAGKMMGEEGNTGLEGLTRYYPECRGQMRVSFTGDYVKFSDVERLLAARAVGDAAQLVAEARAVFDLMLEGCSLQCFGDYQNGLGEEIGPRMDALHEKLRAFASSATCAAAEKPTGDLTYEQIMENYRELGGDTWGQSQQAVADAFRNHVGAIATDDAAGPYVKFRFRSMADADAALESIIASFSLPASQEGAHAAQWISVDERLPEPETDVLIIRMGQIRVGAIFIEHESWEEGGREIHYWDDSNDDGQGWDWCEVTHWMPLPPAPTPACAERSGDHE
jgi:hypothetical protein